MADFNDFSELSDELRKQVDAEIRKRQKELANAMSSIFREWRDTIAIDSEYTITHEPGALSISWKRSAATWLCIDHEEAADRLRRRSANRSLDQARAGERPNFYLGNMKFRPGFVPFKPQYHIERHVFYKSTLDLPPGLLDLAPDCAEAFRQAPLHRFFVIGRDHRPVNQGDVGKGSPWTVIGSEYETMADLIAAIKKEICPPWYFELFSFPKKKCWGCWICGFFAAVAVAGLCWLSQTADGRATANSVFEGLGVSYRFSVPPSSADYETLQSEFEALLQEQEAFDGLVEENRELQRDLVELGARGLESEAVAPNAEVREGAEFGPVACLPVRREHGRIFPTYSYIVTMANADQLSIASLDRGMSESAAAGFTAPTPIAQRNLTIPQFESLVTPVSEEARSRECRHFVLLMENDPEDASRYIAQRDAVERHFYIYRPRR